MPEECGSFTREIAALQNAASYRELSFTSAPALLILDASIKGESIDE